MGWWRTMGKAHHPKGGSNGYRVRLWKIEPRKLANELRMPITVCHLRPGTRKWNKMQATAYFRSVSIPRQSRGL